jgi:DNA-binding MarR family transcriptional regulator
VSSIVSGQLISRTGRYRAFPIMGTAVTAIALFLLSRMDPRTSMGALLGIMLLLGLGMGLVMQVLVVAVQNAVDYKDLGVATSGTTLFRSVGGSVGTAVLGAIFASRLAAEMAARLPAAGAGGGAPREGGGHSLAAIAHLPPAERALYAEGFTAAIATIFLVATGIAVLGHLLAWLIPQRALRETVAATSEEVGEEMAGAMAMPTAPEPQEELVRGLVAVMDRDLRRQHIARIVERAGVGLAAPAAWLLIRVDETPELSIEALAHQSPYDVGLLRSAASELRAAGLVASTGNAAVGVPTREGCAVLERIVAARRAHLAEVFAEWSPEEQQEMAAMLERVKHELVPDARMTGEGSAG